MVGVYVQASLNVAFSYGARKRDDRDVLELVTALDFIQHLLNVQSRDAEVDQHDVGLRCMVELSSLTVLATLLMRVIRLKLNQQWRRMPVDKRFSADHRE